jgi:hypothetical protein
MPSQIKNTIPCAAVRGESGTRRPPVFMSEGRNPAADMAIINHANAVKNQRSAATLFRVISTCAVDIFSPC